MNQEEGIVKIYKDEKGKADYRLTMSPEGTLILKRHLHTVDENGRSKTIIEAFRVGKKNEWEYKLLVDMSKGILTVFNKKGDEYSASIPHLYNKLERQAQESE